VSQPVGTVAALWRFPVKSMLGETVDEADVSERGIAGDRAYALIDGETGKVVSAKNPKRWPGLFGCRASFVAAPGGDEVPAVRITLGDGSSVRSDSPDVGGRLSRFFGRDVVLARPAPADFTIDQYHPDVEDADPGGHRDTVVDQKLGSAFFDEAGLPSPVRVGAFFDLFPLSVLTTSTLDRLNDLSPASRFDERRFRMNVIVRTQKPGFVENEWVGRALGFHDGVQLAVSIPDPRCVMPTLMQEDLPKDNEILRTLVRHNRLDVAGARFPCAGAYATVIAGGTIRPGDQVVLT
jgi:MOSC domain-containing protein